MRLQSISSNNPESRLHGDKCEFYQSNEIFDCLSRHFHMIVHTRREGNFDDITMQLNDITMWRRMCV